MFRCCTPRSILTSKPISIRTSNPGSPFPKQKLEEIQALASRKASERTHNARVREAWPKERSMASSTSVATLIGRVFSLRHLRTGGTLVTVVALTDVRPTSGLTIDFVVEADRAQLTEIVDRIRDGRLRTNIGKVSPLNDVVATFNATERRAGKAIICARP
jgi:hypothetical protein